MKALKTIWSNKTKIFEGVKNSIFKSEHVEEIAAARMEICNACPHIDHEGDSCLVSGTQPCCGKCGCSLKFKIRSLSSSCGDEENPQWTALLDEEEELSIKDQLNYQEPNEDTIQNGGS